MTAAGESPPARLTPQEEWVAMEAVRGELEAVLDGFLRDFPGPPRTGFGNVLRCEIAVGILGEPWRRELRPRLKVDIPAVPGCGMDFPFPPGSMEDHAAYLRGKLEDWVRPMIDGPPGRLSTAI